MEENNLVIPHDSTKHCSLSVLENEKVTDFVYKNFTDVSDESLFCHGDESSNKDRESCTKKPRQTLGKGHCKIQQGAFFTGKILSFGCLVCKDEFTYSPNDLLKHFQVAHEGTLPTYPCDLCGFVTNEFSALQRHRIEHKNTLVTCELCNDGVQYSLLLVTRHYMMRHSQNGHFKCDWCDFTTKDAGTFVQHLHHHNENHWRCPKCRHISLSEDDHQKHIKAHSGVFPFRCPVCGYGAVRNEELKKHVTAVHKHEVERRRPLKTFEDGSLSTSSALKLMLKKSGHFQDTQKISNSNCLPGMLPNQNGRLVHVEQPAEETQNSVDGTVSKKDHSWNNGCHITDQSTSVMLQDADISASSDAVNHKNPNGLTVLMLKNKISIPPNCTTKVMGFKMVDGKKHLVLKVIQSGKPDSKVQSVVSAEELSPSAVLDHSNDSIENGECLDHCSSTPLSLVASQKKHSCLPMDPDDIMAVKVKTEEEETAVCNLDASIHRAGDSTAAQDDPWQKLSSSCSDSMTNDNVVHHIHLGQTLGSEKSRSDNNLWSASMNSDTVLHQASSKPLSSGSGSGVVEEPEVSKSGSRSVLTLADPDSENHRRSFSFHNYHQVCQSSSESTNELSFKSKDGNGEQSSSEPSSSNPTLLRERVVSSENCTQSSANQDVFTFHNYSKDTCGSPLHTPLSFNKTSKYSADSEDTFEFSKVSPTDTPEPLTQNSLEEPFHNELEATEQASGSHDSDERTASVDDPLTEDDNFDLVLQEFNIIKVEDDCVPISKNIPETRSNLTSFGSVAERHSEAIISQQLNNERLKSSSSESSKHTKTTLRILQLPDGKKPVLLRTSENRLAMPVQVKSTPGFKLLTNSAHPQINVSFMTPGVETLTSQSSVTLKSNSSTLAVSSPKAGTAVKGSTLFSPVQPRITSSSSHYFINSPTGLKGPVILSSTPQNSPKDKSVKTQPTCYLLQKSGPAAPSPNTPALRLASTPLSLNSRPVLAMPVNSADKPRSLQSGRQAFLLRYISPTKPGVVLNNQDTKGGTNHFSQSIENASNKVIFKLVTPTGSLLQSGAPPLSSPPLLLATRPQTQCFLVAPNKAHVNASNGVRKLISVQKDVKEPSPQTNVKVQPCDAEKPMLAPRSIRPPSQRKRRRKALFDDEFPATGHKVRRLANRAASEKEAGLLWRPVAKEVERTLRLAPFSSLQQVKCPRRYQPVVVLNHPDADIPEVANIMKVVHRHRGSVSKVSLSQRTVQALAELGAPGTNRSTKVGSSQREGPRPRPVQSSVRERFLLKMMLRKKSRKKYEVVEPSGGQDSVVFDCWFCGRLFNSQEDWIGHGQRHLMEATRDWNKLF